MGLDVFAFGFWGTGGRMNGCENIGAQDRSVKSLAGRNPARPLKEEGHADPAFVHLPFFSPQGKVAAGEFPGRSTVVAEEEDQGVFFQILFRQFFHDPTHAIVEVGQHGGKNSTLDILDMLELVHVFVRCLQGTVDGIIGNE